MTPEDAQKVIASLTPRQREALELRSMGLCAEGIAARMCVSIKTVEMHFAEMHRSTGFTSFHLCWLNGRAGY